MSDDDEERMDRARRIRRMREGRRGGDDGSTDESTDSSATQPESTAAPETESTTEPETQPESTVTESAEPATNGQETDSPQTGSGSRADEGSQSAGEVSAEATEAASESDASEPSETAAGSEIQGPASTDEWFEDGTEPDTQPEGEQTGQSSPAPDAASGEDAGAVESAAAAASAAAAFEVDDPDQIERDPTETESVDTGEHVEEQEEEIRVLEFRLGDEHYCLDIEHVEEIVKESSVTRVPNTPEHVHGVVDLRGQITTILDPKIALDIDDDGGEQLLIVFDAETFEDQGHAGWIVDEVRQVLPITESEVKDSPLDRQSIKGVIERDDEFIIWTTPDVALEQDEN